MRNLALVLASVLTLACHKSADVKGFYLAGTATAVLAPCGDSSVVLSAPDSTLRARYDRVASRPYEPMFVRVRGFSADSAASIYGRLGGAKPGFVVERVLEVRPRMPHDCSGPVAIRLFLPK